LNERIDVARGRVPLWKWFTLDYFRLMAPFRAVRRRMMIAFSVLALGWVGLAAVLDEDVVFSSGPLSDGHAMLENQCFHCHADSWRTAKKLFLDTAGRTMNEACLECHASTIGHDTDKWIVLHEASPARPGAVASQPACASCHREHEGSKALTAVANAVCVECHSDLNARFAMKPGLDPTITAFHADHLNREGFRSQRDSEEDRTRLHFNHHKHMQLENEDGSRTLSCQDCHRAGRSDQDWPRGRAELHEDDGVGWAVHAYGTAKDSGDSFLNEIQNPRETNLREERMLPIRYSLHCAQCHTLEQDVHPIKDRPDDQVIIPHDEPELIRVFLRGWFLNYVREHPEDMTEPPAPSHHRRFTNYLFLRAEQPMLEWVDDRLSMMERHIYNDKALCARCHVQDWRFDGSALPDIAPPSVPQRWFTRASFDHERHRVLSCAECHEKAATSQDTKDILLPGIETCVKCHAPRALSSMTASGGATTDCVSCHSYHRAPSGSPKQGVLSLDELLSRTEAEAN